jgi:hypothetical protein
MVFLGIRLSVPEKQIFLGNRNAATIMRTQAKAKKGRGPTPILWEMVHKLTDDQWRQLKAFSDVYGPGSQQFKLLELLRGMKLHDPAREKEVFSDSSLGAMRHAAKHWLVRTVSRLGFYANELEEQCLDIEVLIQWGMHKLALEHLQKAKEMAREQEDFGWMDRLLKQEVIVARAMFKKGETKRLDLESIANEMANNTQYIKLETDILFHTVKYVDPLRNRFHGIGSEGFSDAIDRAYLETAFFRATIDEWPSSLQIQKLWIDHYFYFLIRQMNSAIGSAEMSLRIFLQNAPIRKFRKDEFAWCLLNLSGYYSMINDKNGVRKILGIFRSFTTEAANKQDIYLLEYFFALVVNGYLMQDLELIGEGAQVWKIYRDLFLSLPSNPRSIVCRIHIAGYYFAKLEIENAKGMINDLHETLLTNPSFGHQALYRFLHLILLIEKRDQSGLESFGINYKRFLKKYFPNSIFAHKVFAALSKSSMLISEDNLREGLSVLLQVLHKCFKSEDDTLNPLTYTAILWTEARLRQLGSIP